MWIYAAMYLGLILTFFLLRKKKEEGASVQGKIFMILAGLITISLLLELNGSKEGSTSLERNSYGEGVRTEELRMQVEGEKEKTVSVKIRPRIYNSTEIQELFLEAVKRLDKEVKGDNQSADHVTEDLILPERLDGLPFQISWEFDRYDVVDLTGKIQKEKLKEVDPKGEGILLTVSGILRYEESENLYEKTFRIFPEDEKKKGIYEQVVDKINASESTNREERSFTLPDNVDGKTISWKKKNVFSPSVVILFGGLISGCLVLFEKERKKEEDKKIREQMLQDYPRIIGQFTLLMGAGMPVKRVWKKIVIDYLAKKENSGITREAYEAMAYAYREMESGVPEGECYERFARRSGLAQYRKLGILLAQNLKKGSAGLAEMLYMESVQTMEDSKSRIRRMGEEAGTRLAGPMMLMLIVVLAIVIVPAFMSIQI